MKPTAGGAARERLMTGRASAGLLVTTGSEASEQSVRNSGTGPYRTNAKKRPHSLVWHLHGRPANLLLNTC